MIAQPADEKDVLDFKFCSIRRIRLNVEITSAECFKATPYTTTQRLAVANSLGRIFAVISLIIHIMLRDLLTHFFDQPQIGWSFF
jgi:hypothetical protein